MQKKHPMDRRSLLGSSLGAALGLGILPSTAFGRSTRREEEPVLVLVQLGGGNDGLATVVPHGDDAYHAARKTTRRTKEELLVLDDYRGLHEELVGLHRRFQDGRLAIVEGVGYPNPNRSHFKSYEIWHTADARGRAAGDGWIGRLCDEAFGSELAPNRVVHVGSDVPYSLHSARHAPAAFTTPAGYRWVKNGDQLGELVEEKEPAGDTLAFIRERMRDARASSAALRSAVVRHRTPVEYPNETFAENLRSAAAIVHGGVGARVVSVELSGFDTHNDERGRHDNLMRTLDGGLTAFLEDLERSELGRRAVVMVFSEFGRRVQENDSRGTDHGTAGPMFVTGGGVKGGLHGAHPSLTELDGGDLVHTTDFRSVYSAVIERCFDVPAKRVLGAEYEPLKLFG